MEDGMPKIDGQDESQIREVAYFLWVNEGCPEGRADDHWMMASGMLRVSAPVSPVEEVEANPPMGEPLPSSDGLPASSAKQ
jgi:hypothetical protein